MEKIGTFRTDSNSFEPGRDITAPVGPKARSREVVGYVTLAALLTSDHDAFVAWGEEGHGSDLAGRATTVDPDGFIEVDDLADAAADDEDALIDWLDNGPSVGTHGEVAEDVAEAIADRNVKRNRMWRERQTFREANGRRIAATQRNPWPSERKSAMVGPIVRVNFDKVEGGVEIVTTDYGRWADDSYYVDGLRSEVAEVCRLAPRQGAKRRRRRGGRRGNRMRVAA